MNNSFNLRSFCHNQGRDSFVGLRFTDNQIKVFFPLGYEIPENDNECRISILNLLKTIALGKSLEQSSNEFGLNSGDREEVPISSFLWIINDYLNNGVYKDIEKTYKRNKKGKINWKKTINSNFYISNNNIIYLNPYVESNVLEKNIISDIHAFSIAQSIKYIGWLFGNFEIPQYNIVEKNIKYYLSLVNKEIMKSFDDRKKNLLFNIKRILEFTSDNTTFNINNYGIYRYEYVFEYMINDVFGNESVEKFFPTSSWHILDWNEIKDSKLKPDTVLSSNNNLYILDSKYYKFGITGKNSDLPHTSSVQKQITYGEYVKNNSKFNYHNVYNAFIIPYNKNNNIFNLSRNIEYIGFSESNWKKNVSQNFFEHVSLILIDTKYLIDNYLNFNKNDLDILIQSIEKVQVTFKSN